MKKLIYLLMSVVLLISCKSNSDMNEVSSVEKMVEELKLAMVNPSREKLESLCSAQTLDSGNPGQASLRILLVFSKSSGNWKLLARQAVRNP